MEANEIHQNKYNYDKSIYVNNKVKLIISCEKHGDFTQIPNSHLKGRGCPICKESKGEMTIRKYLIKNNIEYLQQYKIDKYIYDFYLPEYKLLIEYDGIQHFKPISVFGGLEQFNKQVIVDKNKNELCSDLNINLLRLAYYDKKNISEILDKKIPLK